MNSKTHITDFLKAHVADAVFILAFAAVAFAYKLRALCGSNGVIRSYDVIRSYAKNTYGLFAGIIGKVSAPTALQYINYINNKPIGRIKYALN